MAAIADTPTTGCEICLRRRRRDSHVLEVLHLCISIVVRGHRPRQLVSIVVTKDLCNVFLVGF
jgi:hypothetical protein